MCVASFTTRIIWCALVRFCAGGSYCIYSPLPQYSSNPHSPQKPIPLSRLVCVCAKRSETPFVHPPNPQMRTKHEHEYIWLNISYSMQMLWICMLLWTGTLISNMCMFTKYVWRRFSFGIVPWHFRPWWASPCSNEPQWSQKLGVINVYPCHLCGFRTAYTRKRMPGVA